MKKLTFSLNYRKPKAEYKSSDELMICIRYYHNSPEITKSRIIKKSTGIKCKLKDWDEDWHKNGRRLPVKSSDPSHKIKNKLLTEKVESFKIDELLVKEFQNILKPLIDSKVPKGDISTKWEKYKDSINLVNPANKRNIDVIVVGTGLAGGSASATLAELGYNVKTFCYQDSPRRAHSIAAQGGINAAKNYQGDGDSTYRLFLRYCQRRRL
jgi:hypothetical protein